MIKEITMYTVICDNCGRNSGDDSDYSCWGTPGDAFDIASEESNYIENEGKHYCPDCHTYDDNDNLVIDQSRTKPIQSREEPQ